MGCGIVLVCTGLLMGGNCLGYIILSIFLGAFVGFTMFTRDMIGSKGSGDR